MRWRGDAGGGASQGSAASGVPDTAPISFDAVVQGARRRRIAMTLTVAAAAACVIAGAVTGDRVGGHPFLGRVSHDARAPPEVLSRGPGASGSHSCFRPGHTVTDRRSREDRGRT